MNLSKSVKTLRIKPDASGFTVVAGTSAVNSDIVDTAGYDGVRFIAGFGAITTGAITSVKVQQNDINSSSGMADLEGSAITVADDADNKIAISDIIRPRERYLRMSFSRGTQNAVIDFLIVELYRAHIEPITDDTTVLGSELSLSPAEGTA